MPHEQHRRQLAEFLKSCRARLMPSDVGLPDSRRRRTPGLRREDVAALAGVSVTWYTWLEQGRDIRASEDVLEKISTTLRMSLDEREYLFELVQHRPAPHVISTTDQVSGELSRMIDALNVPALVMTFRWDVVAWNELAGKVFRDYSELDPPQRNLLRHLLVDDEYQADPEMYETIVRRVLARFRVDYSQAPEDAQMNALIDEMSQASPIFDRVWTETEVANRTYGINVVPHPRLGGLTFEHSSYVPEGSPNLRVVVFIPHDDETTLKVAELHSMTRRSSSSKPLN